MSVADALRARPPGQPVQRIRIDDWLPQTNANGPQGNWRDKHRARKSDAEMASLSARVCGLRPVHGRVRLDIVLVYPVERKRDTDNLYARCKGLIDGLVRGGFIDADDTSVLDLHVSARVEKYEIGVELTLESVA